MLDGVAAMTRFLRRIAVEPDIATVPVMVDSSRWAVLEAGLRQLQGRGVVNSISLKEGEAEFLRQARLCRAYGAAVVVMAFDEQGQADSVERRVEVCRRAYRLLTEIVGFAPEDIILDPNIFAIATGIEEHNRYAIAFFEAVRRLKAELPGARTSGGVSNVSFAFRGNDRVREAIHAVFLYHAIRAGLDMAIVNAGVLPVYDDIDPELRERVEDVVLDRRPDATERLTEIAVRYAAVGGMERAAEDLAWRELPVEAAAHARPRRGDRRLDRRGHGRGPADHGPSARGHRGSADGRDERRGRPVRRRTDVPAPGGEERPRHEEGRRPPGPVPRGRARGHRAQGRDARDGDREGRRARHRQEHRRRRARLQRLRRSSTSASWCRRRGSSSGPARSARTSWGCPGSSRRPSTRWSTSPRRWSARASRSRSSSAGRPRPEPTRR